MNTKVYILIGVLVVLLVGVLIYRATINTANQVVPSPSPSMQTSATPLPTPVGKEYLYDLKAARNSSQSGTVRFVEMGNQTKVTIKLTNAPVDVSQPAHIHKGRCPTPGAVLYPLESVVNGMSETIVDASMSGILAQLPVAVNVHKSATQSQVYVACGDLQQSATSSATPVTAR